MGLTCWTDCGKDRDGTRMVFVLYAEVMMVKTNDLFLRLYIVAYAAMAVQRPAYCSVFSGDVQ